MLTHYAALLKSIPARISRTTLLQIVFGDDMAVDEGRLFEDFRLFLLPEERSLVDRAIGAGLDHI